ncbi:MAG: adenine glycosylase [Flaviaesturariibacter sp.]|nr:adenine glycosylase [Flaviaesturariibacter sp.]
MAKEKTGFKPAPADARRFAEALLGWNRDANDRQMPWKGETDPYRIWLSEVILQQTRVEVGRAYYERFLAAFPTVQQLAAAPEQAVFKLWEGLGYYSRCRNLIAAARSIVSDHGGRFPSDYPSILALKGVGPYTAAAIASFAFNLPHAVLDGNVYRVLSRIFAIDTAIDSTEGRKGFATLAQALLPTSEAGTYNQAIMDFGATICKPVPACDACFFNRHCAAFLAGRQTLLPVKGEKAPVRVRWFHYIILQAGNRVAIRQRTSRDIWQSLYEPLLLEAPKTLSKTTLLQHIGAEYGLTIDPSGVLSSTASRTQKLSHQLIHFSFLHALLDEPHPIAGFEWVSTEELTQYPFPRTLQDFLGKNLV